MPLLTIVAGANGAGKSTLTRLGRETFQSNAVLDPDAIAKSMQSTGKSAGSAIDAGREVLRLAYEMIAKEESLVVETTLSGHTYIRMMKMAILKGYRVRLLYVGTSSIEINLERVKDRVRKGGHDVPEEDQRRRYSRSLANLNVAFELAQEAILFDNSSAEGHRKVVVKHGTDIETFEPIPNWVQTVTLG